MAEVERRTFIRLGGVAAACVVCCAGLLAVTHGCARDDRAQGPSNLGSDDPSRTGSGQGSEFTTPATVRSIELSWLAGSVLVKVVDDDETGEAIRIRETFEGDASRLPYMVCGLTGGSRLTIEYGDTISSGLGGCSAGKKNLTVLIPATVARGLESFSLEATSGDYRLEGVGARSMALELLSGKLEVEEGWADDLLIEISSGAVRVDGAFTGRVDLDVASGKVDVSCESDAPASIYADVASGTVNIALPAGTGVTATADRLSGTFTCNGEKVDDGRAYVFGDGSTRLDVDIASGTVDAQIG